ncbi:MAG TPA: universal stress protein [Acidobacteriota bacterium]
MGKFLKNILWATDFSAEAKNALLSAEVFAKAFQAKLLAVHVVPDFSQALHDASPALSAGLAKRVEATKNKMLSDIKALAKAEKISFDKIILKEGSAPKKIIEVSEEEKADLIVLGKKGHSVLENLLIGSVANQVLRHSFIPVLLTKKRARKLQYKKILVPTDFTPKEQIERDYAWRLAKGLNASLTFLHVFELFHKFAPSEIEVIFKALHKKIQAREKREGEDIPISEEIVRAMNAPAGIVDYAQAHSIDLIVISSLVHKLERFFLGSTTEKVISYTDTAVFAIPSSAKPV